MSTAGTTNPAFRKTVETYRRGSMSLEQRYFVDPKLFALEQEKVFGRHWLCVGHQNQVPSRGDYFLTEIGGESLILVRDEKETIRGFYNVCRHRGTRMAEEACGKFRDHIRCPYHAWTYSLSGRLAGAPHMDNVPGFDKADYPLQSVRVEQWEGFIFVNLADDPMPLREFFAPLTGKFADWNLPALRSARRIEYEVKANWKLMFQNYSECYHCPMVHPELSKVSPYDSAENDLSEGPFLGGYMLINKGASLTMSGEACARPVGKTTEAHQNQVFYYSIFPNLLLSLHPDYVMVHQLWPKAPDRTLIYCDWFFHPEAFASAGFRPADAIEFWDMTNRQDWHVCELSQEGITSRAYRRGPYSARESIPAAWDREYLRVLGGVGG